MADISALAQAARDYQRAGRRLMPLHQASKEPVERGWRTRVYSPTQIDGYVRAGCNLAWAMGPRDVALDVDPRKTDPKNGPALDVLARLLAQWPDLALAPLVHTGRGDGGLHYYLRLPEEVEIRNTRALAPLDFRHFGQYVVTAGSIHPDTGRPYYWDDFSDPQAGPLEVPGWLVAELVKSSGDLLEHGGVVRDDTAARYLQMIPVTSCQDYDRWLALGMALHAATGGSLDALDAWVAWSTADPQYADAEEAARSKWRTFRDTGRIGAGTLIHYALEAGGHLIEEAPEDAFAGVAIPQVKSRVDNAEDWIAGLAHLPPTADLDALVSEAHARFSLGDWERLRVALRGATGASLRGLDRLYSKCERAAKRRAAVQAAAGKGDTRDYGIEVAERALRDYYEGGAHLLHAFNQQFYRFCGTHWTPAPQNLILQQLLESAEALRAEGEDPRPSQVLPAAERVLVARSAKYEDVMRFTGEPRPVINTQSAEVWIRGAGGPPVVRAHEPTSYLMSCLDTEYDPAATCPLLDRTILEIFADNAEPGEMVRHWWEFFGYVIQPRKNIPAWWIAHGWGANGKTLLFEVLQAVLGSAVLSRPLADLEEGRNNHATASLVGKLLVIDDDAKTRSPIPESALKKLAESKNFEANPKQRAAFQFRSVATPVVLINDFPKTQDLSWGLLRKTYLLPFCRQFSDEEQDVGLQERILKTELPGALNRALEGYARLRARGRFLEPAECTRAKGEWLRLANPLVGFIEGQTRKDADASELVGDLYESYRTWGRDQGGISHPLSLSRFEVSLRQMGYRVFLDPASDNMPRARGIRFASAVAAQRAIEY